MVKTAAEIQMDRATVRAWELEDREDNRNALERARKMLPLALKNYVTDTQKQYLMAYFAEELTMQEIGARYNVNKATVSRTINRALKRLYDHMRFVDPMFSDLEDMQQLLKLDRKIGCKQPQKARRPYHKRSKYWEDKKYRRPKGDHHGKD